MGEPPCARATREWEEWFGTAIKADFHVSRKWRALSTGYLLVLSLGSSFDTPDLKQTLLDSAFAAAAPAAAAQQPPTATGYHAAALAAADPNRRFA